MLDDNPTKGKNMAITKTHESQLLALDQAIMSVDKKLLILKHITPNNIAEQKQIFIEKSGAYVPQFTYDELTLDLDELERELRAIEIPDIPLAEIYAKKQEESLSKIQFLRAFQQQNTSDMTLYCKKIF